MKNLLIIGYGKVGTHLHHALKKIKGNVNIVNKPGKNVLNKFIPESGIIFICTQDNKISSAVNEISKAVLKGKIIAHTSGALSSDELSALKAKGALTASFHPVQTFMQKAVKDSGLFKKIYIAVEGTPKAVKELSLLAKKINAVPYLISKDFKLMHHLCCVISSNYLVTSMSFIKDVYTRKNGFKKVNFFNIYMPLIKQTLLNIEKSGIEKSLTGPVVRRDLKTIEKHINVLKDTKQKEIIDYYKFMGALTANIAQRREKFNQKDLRLFKKTFRIKN